MLSIKKTGLVLSLLATTIPTYAEEQQAVIVTATRTAQTADESISPVIVISRENLASQSGAEIADVLHHYAGIDIGRTGGPGQQTSIFIRGANSAHTLVMIDGVSINPDISNAALQNIRLDMIERIEIVKGPRSTLYGSQAIGGVINIITRSQMKEGSHYEVHAGGGSFSTKKYGFAAHNKSGDRAAGITFNVSDSEGFPTFSTSNIDRGYDNLSVNLYGKKKMDNTYFDISHNHSSGKSEYLNNIYDVNPPYDVIGVSPVDQDFENNLTTIGINNTPSATWASKMKLSYMEDSIQQNQSTDYNHTQRTALDWQNDIQINEANLLTAGIYAAHERAIYNTIYASFNENTNHYAVFAQNDLQSDSHHLITGIRANDYKAFGNHTTWNLEYGYALDKTMRFNIAANTGFRAPSATDRFYPGSGNPNLNPEQSLNVEAGLRYQNNSHEVTLNYFNNDIEDLITYNYLATPNMQNIGKANINGIEANYQYTGKNWNVGIDAINQDPRNKTNDTLLLRRAKQKYNLSLTHIGDKHRLQLNTTYVGQRKDISSNLDAYTLVGLSGQYKLTKRLSLNGRIENLTDEIYELAATYLTPRRSYYAELRYNFD